MPEGDTIARTAASLHRWIGGREVTGARCPRPATRTPSRTGAAWAGAPGPGIDVARLVGETVTEVEARAKHVLIRLSGGLVVHTHMQMTGAWHVYPTGEPWRKPAGQACLVIETGARLAVCFDAPVVELLRAGDIDAHPSLGRLGPDVLDPAGIDLDVVAARARRRAGVSPTIGELLLDQQVVSGIGNIYRCETLFACGVDPHMATDTVDAELLGRLVGTATRFMVANAAISAFSRSFGAGPDRPWVYGRAGRPCRRCGTPIVRGLLGRQARSVYWCPTCQAPASRPRPVTAEPSALHPRPAGPAPGAPAPPRVTQARRAR